MSWYYAENEQQVGPVDDAAWENLIREGRIKPDTLVWREGMPVWIKYSEASQGAGLAGTDAAPGTGRACAECGTLFPVDELIELDGRPVCAACKPLALQKIREGVAVAGAFQYAGFWIRVGAKVLDGLIIGAANVVLNIGFGLVAGSAGKDSPVAGVALVVLVILQFAVSASYSTWFLGKFGATPGKMACGLKVVRPDGGPVTFMRAFGRFWAEALSAMILYIGYIMVAFDDEKRALHDRICDTRVIRK
jgi:uncharacterized RDD family membrane protein YckC